MARYHDTGTICKATKRPCPLGLSDGDHIEASSSHEFEEKLAAKISGESATNAPWKGTTGAPYKRNKMGEILMPPGKYHFIPVSQVDLVGSSEDWIDAPLTKGLPEGDRKKILDETPVFKSLRENFDEKISTPEASTINAVHYGRSAIAFVGSPTMGEDHSGWTDGTVILPDSVYQEVKTAHEKAGSTFNPREAVHDFESPVEIQDWKGAGVDIEKVGEDEDIPWTGYLINGKQETYESYSGGEPLF